MEIGIRKRIIARGGGSKLRFGAAKNTHSPPWRAAGDWSTAKVQTIDWHSLC